jgi:hypothetical protein
MDRLNCLIEAQIFQDLMFGSVLALALFIDRIAAIVNTAVMIPLIISANIVRIYSIQVSRSYIFQKPST